MTTAPSRPVKMAVTPVAVIRHVVALDNVLLCVSVICPTRYPTGPHAIVGCKSNLVLEPRLPHAHDFDYIHLEYHLLA